MTARIAAVVGAGVLLAGAAVAGDGWIDVDKAVDLAFAPAGAELHYTLTVENLSDGAIGGLLEDAFPPEVAGCWWTCTPSGSASCALPAGTGDVWDVQWLPVGSGVRYDITCTFTPSSGSPCAVNTGSFSTMDPDTVTTDSATTCRADLLVFADGFESGDTSAW